MNIRKLIFLVALFLQVFAVKAQTLNEVRIPLGASVTLNAHSNGSYSYQWYRDGRSIANANQATYTASLAGDYQVIAINQGNCQSDISDVFRVIVEFSDLEIIKTSETRFVGPNENFDYTITVLNKGNTTNTNIVASDQLPSSLKFVAIANVNKGDATYNNHIITWNIAELLVDQTATLVIKVQGKTNGTVMNTARVEGNPALPDPDLTNNTSTDTKRIIGDVKIPNVITPNGDGKNDVLKIEGIELHPENNLSIFNRWGNEVYRSKGYKNDWDGRGLSEGTYYYVFVYNLKDGTKQSVTGYIMLLRN